MIENGTKLVGMITGQGAVGKMPRIIEKLSQIDGVLARARGDGDQAGRGLIPRQSAADPCSGTGPGPPLREASAPAALDRNDMETCRVKQGVVTTAARNEISTTACGATTAPPAS